MARKSSAVEKTDKQDKSNEQDFSIDLIRFDWKKKSISIFFFFLNFFLVGLITLVS